jgi:MFS family permease
MGPLAGVPSDGPGARGLATAGLVVSRASFLLLELLPMNFNYIWFALLIFVFALAMGMFFSPNQASVMNSLPPDQRGAGAGMLNTFQNSVTVLSMGLFFTIVTLGLAAGEKRSRSKKPCGQRSRPNGSRSKSSSRTWTRA